MDEMLANLRRSAGQGARIGFALGAFGLIHAGTVRFLREAKARCDALGAVVLPQAELPRGTEKAALLLKPDERRRILSVMEEVDAVALLDPGEQREIGRLVETAPEAEWMYDPAEGELDREIAARFALLGARWRPISAGQACTTRLILERLAR